MSDYTTRPAGDFAMLGHLKRYLKGIDGFIAGGAFKNVFSKQPVKDIDIFFPSQSSWAKAVKKFRKRGYTQAYENARVIAFIDPITKVRLELIGAQVDEEWPDNDLPVEFTEPQQTIANFDFTVTKFALVRRRVELTDPFAEDAQPFEWVVIHHRSFFEHLYLKRLVIDAELVKPLSTFERSYRYAGYGYQLCRESKVKLIREIQATEFESEAQLSASFYNGVD